MTDSDHLRDTLRSTRREIVGPEPDEVDQAIRSLTAARRVLRDKPLMAAIKERLDEQRAAVAQSEDAHNG